MKITNNFSLQELVDKETFSKWGGFSQKFLDEDTVKLLQFMRDRWGSLRVNDWSYGGKLQYRGLRPPNCTVGGSMSQHRFGRAFDLNSNRLSPNEMRADILNNESLFLDHGLTRIEDGNFAPTWLHFDTAWTGDNKIHIVKP